MIAPLLVAVALVTAPPLPPTTAATAPEPPSAGGWYGGPALATEAASLGVLALTGAYVVNRRSLLAAPLAIVGFGGLALGGPVNHAVHGHLGRAWGSLGLRFGALVVGFVGAGIVATSERCFGDEPGPCPSAPIALVFSLPLVVAYVFDDVFWAREPPPDRAAPGEKLPPRQHLGVSLLSGGLLVTAVAGGFLTANLKQVHDSELAAAGAPGDSGAQFNLDKARLGRDLGIGFLVAGLGGIGVGAYLLTSKPADGASAVTLAPWADRRASGLSFVARF